MTGWVGQLWLAVALVGGVWWIADNEDRPGEKVLLGILPWTRGVFIAVLAKGWADEGLAVVVTMGLMVFMPGIYKPDAGRPRWGKLVPAPVGKACLLVAEGAAAVAAALALAGLVAGMQIGGPATAWAYQPGQTGIFAEFLADSDYEFGWRIVADCGGLWRPGGRWRCYGSLSILPKGLQTRLQARIRLALEQISPVPPSPIDSCAVEANTNLLPGGGNRRRRVSSDGVQRTRMGWEQNDVQFSQAAR